MLYRKIIIVSSEMFKNHSNTRQAMHQTVTLRGVVQPLLWRKSSNYCTFLLNVFVALGVQHAMRMCHIVICGLSGCAIFFHIIP